MSTTFENYPIEFKEINPEDFTLTYNLDGTTSARDAFIIENNGEKIIIKPNDEGYLSDKLLPVLEEDSNHKNTVVINAGVGQGKTTAIIQAIKMYYENTEQEYLVIVATPYVSLVKQYVKDINAKANIPLEQIYDYANIGTNEEPYIDKKVHVITVNTLLQNPGEDSFKNSDAKRSYLDTLSNYCESANKKVVFIYDEIHASYYNFKEEYIFSLWKWRNVIHKNYVVSATYNEASKIVIEYLAELTNNRIKIIESERIRIPKRQSSLFLHFSPATRFEAETSELVNLINSKLEEGKEMDILCYSKTLSTKIVNSEIGKKIREKLGIKLCVSELENNENTTNSEPKNRYDESKCNVGTNFSTGLSIEKENHAFIIILPPENSRGAFKNYYGVFTYGINSIIQALARQRTKGEIHVLLAHPDNFEEESLGHMTATQKADFLGVYNQISRQRKKKDDKGKLIESKVNYHNINTQHNILRIFYKFMRDGLNDEISLLSNRNPENQPSLSYPSFSNFILEKGEDYIVSKYKIFGEDISACLTYLALTNQFLNCKLEGISQKPKIVFSKGNILKELGKFYIEYFGNEMPYLETRRNANFNYFYNDIRDFLFLNFSLKLKKGDLEEDLGEYKVKVFETKLFQFCVLLYTSKFQEIEKLKRDYFLTNIKVASESSEETDKVKLYQLLNDFKNQVIANIECYDNYDFLPNSPNDNLFSESNKGKIIELENLITSDELLANDVFNFKRRIEDKTSQEDKIKALYKLIIEIFFESTNYRLTTGTRARGKKVTQINLTLPILDLISIPNPDITTIEEDIYEHFGSMEEFLKAEKEIQEAIKNIEL